MKNCALKRREKTNNRTRRTEGVVAGSGNVYADLGFADPEGMLAKAQVVRRIVNIIDERRLTQARAAELLALSQPKVSGLMRGKFAGFSMDRLLRFLNVLGQNVEIVIRPMPSSQAQAHTHVTTG